MLFSNLIFCINLKIIKVLDIRLVTKEIWPTNEVNYWCKMILNKDDSGLIQNLAALNQIIQE